MFLKSVTYFAASMFLLCFGALSAYADNPFFEPESGAVIGTGWNGPHIVADISGQIFTVESDGRLRLYWHDDDFSQNFHISGPTVGTGWNQKFVLARGMGKFYVVFPNGQLKWYDRGDASDFEYWEPGSGTIVGDGWQTPTAVIGGTDGRIYAVKEGNLLRYQHDGGPDISNWSETNTVIGRGGWDEFVHLAAYDRYIFAVDSDGDLWLYIDDGSGTLAPGRVIGKGWHGFKRLIPVRETIYAQKNNGDLLKYVLTHEAYDTGKSLFSGLALGEGNLQYARDTLQYPFGGSVRTTNVEQRACIIIKAGSDKCADMKSNPIYGIYDMSYLGEVFAEACFERDLCFASTGQSKLSCDEMFVMHMKQQCQNSRSTVECGIFVTDFEARSLLADKNPSYTHRRLVNDKDPELEIYRRLKPIRENVCWVP